MKTKLTLLIIVATVFGSFAQTNIVAESLEAGAKLGFRCAKLGGTKDDLRVIIKAFHDNRPDIVLKWFEDAATPKLSTNFLYITNWGPIYTNLTVTNDVTPKCTTNHVWQPGCGKVGCAAIHNYQMRHCAVCPQSQSYIGEWN